MKTKKLQRVFAFLLVLTLINVMLPLYANAETGSDYAYTVNPDGTTCHITGYTGTGGDITVPASLDGYTVTSFKEYVFADCSSLTGVTIPASFTSIEKGTFANCTNLSSVTIPSSVTSIGHYAFDRCSSLTSITLPNSVKTIGDYAFVDCSSLTSINLPNGVTSIGECAFKRCSNLTKVMMSSTVTSIGIDAFRDCSSLTSLTIPKSMSHIGDYTFRNCTGLTSITIPNSITSIGWCAFEGCSSLTSITIPSSVEIIDFQAFHQCPKLETVYLDGESITVHQYAFSGVYPTFYCPAGNLGGFPTVPVAELGTYPVAINSALNGTITPSVTSGMPGEIISLNINPAKGYSLKPGSLKYNDDIINGTSFTMPRSSVTVSAEFELDTIAPTANLIFPSGTNIPVLTSNIMLAFSESVTGVSGKKVSVSDGSNIYVYTIGESDNYFGETDSGYVATIPMASFLNGTEPLSLGCDATSYTVAIEAGAYIDDADNPIAASHIGSFSTAKTYTYTVNPDGTSCTITGYTSLRRDITIPASLDGYTVTSFAEYVFADCGVLTDLTIPSNVTSIAKGAFANCSNLSSVTIESGTTSIGHYAFDRCSSLTSITIPNSVKSIGNYAFKDCRNLNSISILYGVTSIGDSAFSYCSKLTEVIIPSSVTSIANNAFNVCSGLNRVEIASGVTSIGDNAFSGCSGLTEISVDEANTHYSSLDGVLYNFDKTSLICYPAGLSGAFTIPSSVTSIRNSSFSNCSGLTGVTIPVSVTSIENNAFSGCINLASMTIPSSITSIGNTAFQSCAALSHAYFDGDMPITGLSVFNGCSESLEYHSPTENPGGITLSPLTTLETRAVTISPTENGTVSPSTVDGMPGETISLEITPAAGYRLKPGSLKYNDGSDDSSISGISFTMPDNAITISGVFAEIDNTLPIANMVSPSGTNVALSASDIVLGFSETVTAVENKSVTISDGTNTYTYIIGASNGYVSGISSDCKATIPISRFLNGTAPLSLDYNTTYAVTLEAGAYIDSADNETAASIIGSFKTEAEPVTVTSVSVKTEPTKTTYTAGDSLNLTGLVITLHKSDSSTEDVAFADFGSKGLTVSPANGSELTTSHNKVTITHTASGKSEDQTITVNPAPVTVTSVSVKTEPTKTTYTAGDSLNLAGLVITLHKSDSSTEDVTFADFGSKGLTVSPANGSELTTSHNKVTITHTASGKSEDQTITVNPAPVTVTSVSVKTEPTKTTYTAGDSLNLTGLVITLHKSDSSTEDVAFADFGSKGLTVSPANGSELTTSHNKVTITHTASGKSEDQTITINPAPVTVTSVSVKTEPTKTTYTAGDSLNLTGLVITLHKSDSSTEDVAFADFGSKGLTVSPANGSELTTSHNKVIITHTASGKSSDQTITVNPAPVTVTSVSVKTEPTKTTYTAGDSLNLTGLVITLHKSDSSTEDVAFADFGSKGLTVSPANGSELTTSHNKVTIAHTASGKSEDQTITVNPAPVTVTSVSVKTEPTKTTYTAGNSLNLEGLVITLHKSDSSTEDVAFADFGSKGLTVSPANGSELTTSHNKVTFTHTSSGKSEDQTITVNPAPVVVTSVTVKTEPTKTTYTAGDSLNLAGLVITLHKSDSSTEDVAFADFGSKGLTVSPANGSELTTSHNKVTFTHTSSGKSDDQTITVNPAPVMDIDASISPTSVNYDFNAPADVVTTITWNSASTITDVVYNSVSLTTPDAYVVTGSSLTIKSEYIDTLGLSAGDTAEFEISFDVGASVAFTVDIESNLTLSDNADLKSLTVNGDKVSGFDPDKTEYDVELPYGTATAVVDATPAEEHGFVVITQASILPGSATVVVTAQDTTTEMTYTINFTLGAEPNVPVTSISVTDTVGTASVEVGGTLQMLADVSPSHATNQAVDWSIKGGSGDATISAGGRLMANTAGTVIVRATAKDGSGVYDDKEITIIHPTPTDKTLVSISTPDDITGLANGTAKNASALGLPSTVTLVTDSGNVNANVA